VTEQERPQDGETGQAPAAETSGTASEAGPRFASAGSRLSLIAAAIVLLLTAGALIWPGGGTGAFRGVCLVFDPSGSARESNLYEPLVAFLSETTGQDFRLERVTTVQEFRAEAARGVDLAVCPDGLGLTLDQERFVPLAAGRRTAPRNLRPRCVLVYRQAAGLSGQPWVSAPGRTIFGDSLSLCATGILRSEAPAAGLPAGCTSGPDPYDHGVALHALRLGSFDYAVVRQWDAERFFAESLLEPADWRMEILTGPVPDLVLLASREIPPQTLLELGDALTRLGRTDAESGPLASALERGLAGVHLSGFNLLVEPDLDLVRSSFPANWPPAGQ